MKIVKKINLLVCVLLMFSSGLNAQVGYYDAPYTRYEADLGTLANGASITAKSFDQSLVQSEASDQTCVNLSASGASVSWTVSSDGDGLVVRYSIPDGQTASIDVYGNGVFEGTLNLTTYYSWEYLSTNGNSNNVGVVNANPKMRFDEVRMKLPTKVLAGQSLRLVRTSGNISLDFAELELIPPAVTASGSDVTYNGTGLQNFINNNGGKTIYLPPGTYYSGTELYFGVNDTKLKGAGMWYTEINFTEPNTCDGGSGGLRADAYGIGYSGLYLSTVRNSRSCSYKAINGVYTGASLITNVWAEHFECGAWIAKYTGVGPAYADGFTMSYCRFRNNYADGTNLCVGASNAIVEHCSYRNNGDDDMAVWPATGSGHEGQNNTFRYCTSENTWRSAGCAIYGGYNNQAYNLLIKDNVEVGLKVNNYFGGYPFNGAGMHVFSNIRIIGCGTFRDLFNSPVGAIDLLSTSNNGNTVSNVKFSCIEILNSKNDAIYVNKTTGNGFNNLVFENIKIDGTGKEYASNGNNANIRGYGVLFGNNPGGYGTYCGMSYANLGGSVAANTGGSFGWTAAGSCPSGCSLPPLVTPSSTVMTSATTFGTCNSPITLSAITTAPAGNTVSYIEFFVDGTSIGKALSAPYNKTWSTPTPTVGTHSVYAVAGYSGGTTSISLTQKVTIADPIYSTVTAPTIDGTIDPLWGNYTAFPLTKLSQGSISGSADLSATFQMTSNATNLFILVNVTDDILKNNGGANWQKDALELFIDMGNKKNTTYGTTDFQYNFVYNDLTVYETQNNATSGVTFKQGAKTGGYIMEISIPWSTLGGAPSAGSFMGFELGIDDNDNTGTIRDAKIAWNDATDNAWQNPSLFGAFQIAATPTLTLSNASKIYGDAPFTVAASSNSSGALSYSILGGSTLASINSSSGQVTINGAGTVSVGVSQAASGCFSGTTASGTLTISKKTLSAVANNQSKTYNTPNPTLTISYTGFVGSDNAVGIDSPPTITTTAVLNSPVGTYPITASGGLDNNYTFTFTGGTLAVNKATPTLSITSINTGLVGTTIGLTAASNSTGAITWSVVSGNGSISGSTLTLLSVGSVTVQANLATDANYNAATTQQVITISALTAPSITYADVAKTYGNAPFAMTASSNSPGAFTYSITAGTAFAAINASTGTVTILGAGTVNVQANQVQSGTFAAGTKTAILTIAKGVLNATPDNKAKVYNTANPTFTISYTGFVGSDNAAGVDTPPTMTTTAIVSSPVNTYPINAYGGLDNNYIFNFNSGTLTVTKATPSLSITSTNSGQAGSTISLTSSSNSTGAVTWTVVSGNGSITGSTLTLLGAGSVTIQANLASDANYLAASAQQTITISSQTPPTISFADANKVYGDAPFSMTATSNSPGALTYSITSGNAFASINASTGTVTILGAGTVTLQVNQAQSGTYAAGTKTATLTISKKALTATANNQSRAYNASNPVFTVSYSGFVGTDNSSGIDVLPNASSSATVSSNAGTYTITVTGGTDNNYSFIYILGTLTITKITPTLNITSNNVGQAGNTINLTASSNSTGTITWSYVSGNGTVVGNTLSLGTSGTVVVQANQAADVNYNSIAAQQTITITSLIVPNISFVDVTKTYGDAPFTISATSNSTGAFAYSITSGNSFASVSPGGLVTISNAGTVTLKVDQAANGPYSASSKTATLTINKKSLTVKAYDKTRLYNTSNPTFTVSYTGFVGSETASVLDTPPLASSSATSSSNTGTYPIVPTGGSDNNYSFTYSNGTLTITSINPSLTITSTNSGQAGSTINLTSSSNSTGAVTWSVVSGNGSISGSTLTLLSPSSVTVQASLSASVNYNSATSQQVISITPKTTPTITFANLSATYGDPNFILSVSSNSPGLLGYSIISGNSFATINPTTGLVQINGAGTVTIQVVQASSGTFAATTTTGQLTINKAIRTITITSVNMGAVNDVINLTANVSPTANVNWSVTNTTGAASVSGTSMTLTGQGQVTVNANIPADANYLAAFANQPFTISTITAVEALLTTGLGLSVSPNPYETESTITFTLPSDANVSLEVINTIGVTVTNLAENIRLNSGYHSFTLHNLPTATYFIKLTVGNNVSYTRVVKQ